RGIEICGVFEHCLRQILDVARSVCQEEQFADRRIFDLKIQAGQCGNGVRAVLDLKPRKATRLRPFADRREEMLLKRVSLYESGLKELHQITKRGGGIIV